MPISRKPLRADVHKELLGLILQGTLTPGQRLRDTELAQQLGVSRTPVREAQQVLQNEGFVTVCPKQGVRFQGFTTTALREILELRAAVEGYVMAACLPLSERHLAEVEALVELQRPYSVSGDVEAYLVHDAAFHNFFVELYGNSLISAVVRSISERFRSVGLRILRDAESVRLSFQGHLAIMEAVRAADVAAALTAVHAHINFGKSRLLSAVDPVSGEGFIRERFEEAERSLRC